MCKKLFHKFMAFMLVGVFLFNLIPVAFATDSSNFESANSTTPTADVQNSEIIWGDGYIEERVEIEVDGNAVNMVRTSYENGTAVMSISENGVVTTTTFEINYARLAETLKGSRFGSLPVTRGRVSGYTYTYMKTVTQIEYYEAEYGTYAALLSGLSAFLAYYGIPGANVVSIASAIYSFNSSAVDSKFIYYRHWYEVTETSSGGFIGYYCEWSVFTYVKDGNGNWVYLAPYESGSFDSFNVY